MVFVALVRYKSTVIYTSSKTYEQARPRLGKAVTQKQECSDIQDYDPKLIYTIPALT